MTNPLLIDSVEKAFVPALIVNNTGGDDAKVLKKFKEPAWNYQVIRFFDKDHKDIIPRKGIETNLAELAQRTEAALLKQKKDIPESLKMLRLETDVSKHKKVAFAMFCYWTGEMELGGVDGVVYTESGWLEGREVTLVTYHTDKVQVETIIKKAASVKCANKVFLPQNAQYKPSDETKHLKYGQLTDKYRIAKQSDQKKQLEGTKYSKINLSPIQKTKLNSFIIKDRSKIESVLTKKQLSSL